MEGSQTKDKQTTSTAQASHRKTVEGKHQNKSPAARLLPLPPVQPRWSVPADDTLHLIEAFFDKSAHEGCA